MKKILDKVYEPQSVFQKTNSVYMEWYGRGDEKMYKEKSGANQVMVDYIQKNAKETGKTKSVIFIFGSLYLLGAGIHAPVGASWCAHCAWIPA